MESIFEEEVQATLLDTEKFWADMSDVVSEEAVPPCQNSCRLVMIFNFGAIRNKYGALRRDIEE